MYETWDIRKVIGCLARIDTRILLDREKKISL